MAVEEQHQQKEWHFKHHPMEPCLSNAMQSLQNNQFGVFSLDVLIIKPVKLSEKDAYIYNHDLTNLK